MNRLDEQLPPDGIEAAAASWLARRDRGFSGAEQDAYLQWLQESPSHGTAVARLEKTWGVLDQLSEWRPAHSQQPNPDLLAPHRISRRLWFGAGALAAAAALALGLFVSQPAPAPAGAAPVARLVQNSNTRKLADGSVVEMNRGSEIDVVYQDSERRVKLLRGEAHFTVTKDPNRPFIVEAGGVAVRAIGTAFNVRMSASSVEVLVTSGTVQVDSSTPIVAGSAVAAPLAPKVDAGHRVVLPTANPTEPVAIQSVSSADIERALAWQGLRLDFVEATLAQAVAEFNRHNQHQLIVTDSTLGNVKIGGNFRADNVDGFVRLMVTTLGVTADRTGDNQTTLRK
jgi:transmembrane sensor